MQTALGVPNHPVDGHDMIKSNLKIAHRYKNINIFEWDIKWKRIILLLVYKINNNK